MATALHLPAFPRHGILLNSSPSTSPYAHTTSLPGTPHLISSLSSLSSSASSTSPHTSEPEQGYFHTYSALASVTPRAGASLSREGSTKHPVSAPQTRKIRFAPLPEPRRDDALTLPSVFLDDSVESLPFPSAPSTPLPESSSRPSSLLFSGSEVQAPAELAVQAASISGSERDDDEWEPLSPAASGSTERLPQSCPESPLSRRPDLPKPSLKQKLLRPLKSRNISTEDVLTLGVNTLFRAATKESEEEWGAPLCRSTSDNTPSKRSGKHKMGWFSGGEELGRTQSATADMRRVQSRESDKDAKRPRSGSSNEPYGPRKQLRMLNGRVYGAKRGSLAKTNLFASARSEEPEFVEWGYGGMGSVKTAASVGADNKWSRVAGASAIAAAHKGPAEEEDDGSGMAWLKKRREQREREKAEAAAAAPTEEHKQEEGPKETADPDPPNEHVTTAVTLPAHHRPTHQRVPSAARMPERRDSEDTARAISPPPPSSDADVLRARRESQSSTSSAEEGSEEAEESARESEDESEEDEAERRTALGAGVEKISRHKEKAHDAAGV